MDLYEWQRECIDLGKTGTSVIVRAPTSAGKSRACDAILMHRLKQLGGVALVVLPFVALCDERSEQIAVGLTGTDIRLVRMYGGQGGALHNWQRDTIVARPSGPISSSRRPSSSNGPVRSSSRSSTRRTCCAIDREGVRCKVF